MSSDIDSKVVEMRSLHGGDHGALRNGAVDQAYLRVVHRLEDHLRGHDRAAHIHEDRVHRSRSRQVIPPFGHKKCPLQAVLQ